MTTSAWTIAVVDEWAPARSPDASAPELRGGLAEVAALLVSGQCGAAMRAANEALERARSASDGASGMLALGLRWLAEVRNYNLLPGGCGLNSLDGSIRWNGVKRAEQMMSEANVVRHWPNGDKVREVWRWLEFAATRSVAAATLRDARRTSLLTQLAPLQIHQCEFFRQNAEALSGSALGFVERTVADLWWRAGEVNRAHQQLDRARTVYESADDKIGAATCHAIACDRAIARWSSALVRNLEVLEAAYPTSELAWLVEQSEGETANVDVAASQAQVAKAVANADKAGATRVLGYLSLLEGFLARLRGDNAEQLSHLDKALAVFGAEHDELHTQLATTHRLLAQIDAGRVSEGQEEAAAIGEWGAANGSFSYALGLGLIMTRAGRQSLLRNGDYERADACFQLALVLNRALGTEYRVAQTLADLGALSRTLGHRARARSMQGEALDKLAALAQQSEAAGATERLALLTQSLFRGA
jgi:tetratricopeptide (TPR) repeat protein